MAQYKKNGGAVSTDMGIVEPSDNSLKPYTIVKSKEELQEIMEAFFSENLADNKTDSEYAQDLHDVANDRCYSPIVFRQVFFPKIGKKNSQL